MAWFPFVSRGFLFSPGGKEGVYPTLTPVGSVRILSAAEGSVGVGYLQNHRFSWFLTPEAGALQSSHLEGLLNYCAEGCPELLIQQVCAGPKNMHL